MPTRTYDLKYGEGARPLTEKREKAFRHDTKTQKVIENFKKLYPNAKPSAINLMLNTIVKETGYAKIEPKKRKFTSGRPKPYQGYGQFGVGNVRDTMRLYGDKVDQLLKGTGFTRRNIDEGTFDASDNDPRHNKAIVLALLGAKLSQSTEEDPEKRMSVSGGRPISKEEMVKFYGRHQQGPTGYNQLVTLAVRGKGAGPKNLETKAEKNLDTETFNRVKRRGRRAMARALLQSYKDTVNEFTAESERVQYSETGKGGRQMEKKSKVQRSPVSEKDKQATPPAGLMAKIKKFYTENIKGGDPRGVADIPKTVKKTRERQQKLIDEEKRKAAEARARKKRPTVGPRM
jgi:hypothetical protein